jgi:hypothetical protein
VTSCQTNIVMILNSMDNKVRRLKYLTLRFHTLPFFCQKSNQILDDFERWNGFQRRSSRLHQFLHAAQAAFPVFYSLDKV